MVTANVRGMECRDVGPISKRLLRVRLFRCSHADVGAAEKAEQFQPDLFWEMRK